MKRNLLSHRYTKVGHKTDPMVNQVTKAGQIMEAGGIAQTIMQGKIIEAINSEETSGGTIDRIVGKVKGMKGIVIIVEIGIG